MVKCQNEAEARCWHLYYEMDAPDIEGPELIEKFMPHGHADFKSVWDAARKLIAKVYSVAEGMPTLFNDMEHERVRQHFTGYQACIFDEPASEPNKEGTVVWLCVHQENTYFLYLGDWYERSPNAEVNWYDGPTRKREEEPPFKNT
jgi:hypothetical protein